MGDIQDGPNSNWRRYGSGTASPSYFLITFENGLSEPVFHNSAIVEAPVALDN